MYRWLQQDQMAARVIYRVATDENAVMELWSLSDLFSDAPLALAASQQKVFLAGDFKHPSDTQVLAFDAADGTWVWNSDQGKYSLVELEATPTAVYSASAGNAMLRAYDLNTGRILWAQQMPDARYVSGFNVVDNLIYVASSSGYQLLRTNTGEILQTFTELPTATTLQELEDQLGLASNTRMRPEYFWVNTFTEDVFLVKSQGAVWAIDRKNGDRLWEVEDVLSNVEATEFAVYFLTKDHRLLGLEPHSGETISSVQFEPRLTTISNKGFESVFYVAVDQESGMIYVFLGDGAQLFAFELSDRTR